MSNALEVFRKKLSHLKKETADHGKIGEFCKSAGITRTALQGWLRDNKPAYPSLDKIEGVARALGETPWELLKPENAKETPKAGDPADDLRALRDEIHALRGLFRPNRPTVDSILFGDIVVALNQLESHELSIALGRIKELIERRDGVDVSLGESSEPVSNNPKLK